MNDTRVYLEEKFGDLLKEVKSVELKEKALDLMIFMTNEGQKNGVDWEMPFTLNFEFPEKFTLAHHTYWVTKIAMSAAKDFEEGMGIKVNWDELIIGGLLHDIAKLLESAKSEDGKFHKDTDYFKMFRHPSLGAIYAKKFDLPDSICHTILVHAGEGNALLRSLEAQIIHRADFIYYGGLRSSMGIK